MDGRADGWMDAMTTDTTHTPITMRSISRHMAWHGRIDGMDGCDVQHHAMDRHTRSHAHLHTQTASLARHDAYSEREGCMSVCVCRVRVSGCVCVWVSELVPVLSALVVTLSLCRVMSLRTFTRATDGRTDG